MVALRMLIFSTVFILSSLLLVSPTPAKADVLFEGYSKILLAGSHIGYAVQRYEFDNKKQEFASTYFIRIETGALKYSESLKARANSKLQPISYFYTRLDGEPAKNAASPTAGVEVKTIDAHFKNNKLSAVVRENGKSQTIIRDIPKSSFLSTFLFYLILQSKEGFKVNNNFQFEAVVEEQAALSKGSSFIKSAQSQNGVDSFRILNKFAGEDYVSIVTPRGEILATESPSRKLSTELVANMKDAIGGLSFKPATLESLFGSVPKGKDNVLARTSSAATATPQPTATPKKQ